MGDAQTFAVANGCMSNTVPKRRANRQYDTGVLMTGRCPSKVQVSRNHRFRCELPNSPRLIDDASEDWKRR